MAAANAVVIINIFATMKNFIYHHKYQNYKKVNRVVSGQYVHSIPTLSNDSLLSCLWITKDKQALKPDNCTYLYPVILSIVKIIGVQKMSQNGELVN